MSICEVIPKLRLLKAVGDEPDIIMLHCGGNDIGRISVARLRFHVSRILKFIEHNFNARVVWSEILPRKVWRYSANNNAMEAVRKRLNNFAATQTIRRNGFYVKHPDLKDLEDALYIVDGVHLTFLGNCIFLNQLSSAFLVFKSGKSVCFK